MNDNAKNLQPSCNKLATDCISRQAAITQLSHNKNKGDDEWELAVQNDIQTIWKLPAAQPKTHDKRTESHACDLISRQALCEYALNQKNKNITANDIMRFPPAQPKSYREGYQAGYKDAQSETAERTAETAQNVSDSDLISRKAAIDALGEKPLAWIESEYEAGLQNKWESDVEALKELPSAQPDLGKYEYHYDHTDCIWYRPEARNRCPVTCAQYRDGWNDAMNYIFRDGKGYRPYRRGEQYEE